MSQALAACVKLANGVNIPQIQLGLYMTSGKESKQAVRWALEAGYRGFDSAQMYGNERETGDSIKEFLSSKDNKDGLKREDIWFTTKLASNSTYNAARKSITTSLQKCGLGYIDLFLLHSPYGGTQARLESWRAISDAIQAGEIRCGGVSNFGIRHIEELAASKPRTMPCVNQIEVHPFNTRTALVAACQQHGMVVEAYAPLARALRMKHPVIVELAGKYGCRPGQLMVKWSVQRGFVTLPKSVNQRRIAENGAVDGLVIEEQDVDRMAGLDEELVTDWDPLDAP